MSSTEQEPCVRKPKMESTSEDTSSSILENADATIEVPIKKFSLITAMMDTVPDILVDNVLSDLKFRDVFTFKCVSHRCHDIVLANLKRLNKPEKVAIRITWGNFTKSIIFGQRVGDSLFANTLLDTANNTFVVVDHAIGQMNADPTNSWREGSVLFTERHALGVGYSRTEVSSVGADDMDIVVFLLKKFLPNIIVNGIIAVRLEKEDFGIISETLKTHAVTGEMYIAVQGPDKNPQGHPNAVANAAVNVPAPILHIEDVVTIVDNKQLASIFAWNVHSDVVPKSFFKTYCMKSIVKISLNFLPNTLAAEFDDEMLLSTFPQLNFLAIGQCDVTTAGLNTFLKQYIAGGREFSLIELKLRHPNELVEKDVLWTELVEGIPWPDYNDIFTSAEESGNRQLGMCFLDKECSRSVKFYGSMFYARRSLE